MRPEWPIYSGKKVDRAFLTKGKQTGGERIVSDVRVRTHHNVNHSFRGDR